MLLLPIKIGIRMITVVIGVEAIDGDPYARFVATANLMNYVSQNFIASLIVSKGEAYNNSKSTVLDGKKQVPPLSPRMTSL